MSFASNKWCTMSNMAGFLWRTPTFRVPSRDDTAPFRGQKTWRPGLGFPRESGITGLVVDCTGYPDVADFITAGGVLFLPFFGGFEGFEGVCVCVFFCFFWGEGGKRVCVRVFFLGGGVKKWRKGGAWGKEGGV